MFQYSAKPPKRADFAVVMIYSYILLITFVSSVYQAMQKRTNP